MVRTRYIAKKSKYNALLKNVESLLKPVRVSIKEPHMDVIKVNKLFKASNAAFPSYLKSPNSSNSYIMNDNNNINREKE